ncbi:GFA family protein [Patulibacter sp. NPDC049589]|uniref:GFA family protein n=1 Tax=Patulibacter sp. NPDC049589 TaxID=3154731 RepID=UPI003418965E
MSDSQTGHCLCGAVQYHYDGDPALTAICHCDDCQRQSGTSFSVNVAVPRAQFHLTAGDAALRQFETVGTDSEKPRARNFCGTCGSPVFTVLSEMPELAFIKAGTLDDRAGLAPQLEVWCDRAQPWVDHADRPTHPRDLQQ